MSQETQADAFPSSTGPNQRLCRVRDLPPMLRPREEIERRGFGGVSDAALLAVLLRVGYRGQNVLDLAQSLLRDYRNLTNLARAPLEELRHRKGIGRVKAITLKAALELGRRLTEEALLGEDAPMNAPDRVAALLREEARRLDREKFWVLLLNTKLRLIKPPVEVFSGSLDGCPVHPRELFKEALVASASSLVLAHNHPSGDPTPSTEDIHITRRLVEAGSLLGISVLDHIIIGRRRQDAPTDYCSLRESHVTLFKT